jgi:hypothetical protein
MNLSRNGLSLQSKLSLKLSNTMLAVLVFVNFNSLALASA